MRALLFTALLFFLTGCHTRMLQVRSEYLTPDYLASQRVETPDPCKNCYFGQQVIVHWYLPPNECYSDLSLIATIRYGTRQIEEICVPLRKTSGYWIYRLLNADYFRKCGIVAYKVDLCAQDGILCSWRHHLWSEIIEISH